MTPEETVRAECAAWGPRDLDEITSYFAPDAIWSIGLERSTPLRKPAARGSGTSVRTNGSRLRYL